MGGFVFYVASTASNRRGAMVVSTQMALKAKLFLIVMFR
jgi:hypothetical protein